MRNQSAEYLNFSGKTGKMLGKDWDRIQDQVDSSWTMLSHIPDSAWLEMTQMAVRQWEVWPRNFYRAVSDIYQEWARTRGGSTVYHREDDPRFPVGLLWDGFGILDTKGKQAFIAYCDAVHMPLNDRERVQNKHKLSNIGEFSKFKLPEIGIRTNPKINRPDVIPYREPGEEG